MGRIGALHTELRAAEDKLKRVDGLIEDGLT